MEPLLVLKGIKKYFPGTKALDWDPTDVMEVYPGEIHGLVGENGAGKSTLFQIIMGIYKKNDGEMFLDNKPFEPHDALDAEKHGISIIMQQPNILTNMTVAENIFIGRDSEFRTKTGLLMLKKQKLAAAVVLKKLGFDHIAPDALLENLDFEERKQVEIARALSNDPRILLVDETSAAVSKESLDSLYRMLRLQKEKGVCIIYISHFIDEVYKLCDKVTIMRDGHYIKLMNVAESTPDMIIQNMVGRKVTLSNYRSEDNSSIGDTILETKSLTIKNAFHDISLNVHRGEIVGIAGIGGCGSEEFGKALFGYEKVDHGSIIYKGEEIRLASPVSALQHRIGYIPKDRDRAGLVLMFDLIDNISSASLQKLQNHGFMKRKSEIEMARKFVSLFRIKTPGITTNVSDLSGGNRQKVAIAKWIANNSDFLVVNSPTRGVDVGAKYEIYKILETLKNEGKGILLISDELPELMGMCDRIYTFCKGRISGEFFRATDFDEQIVVSKMVLLAE